jgi:hypothetical protein
MHLNICIIQQTNSKQQTETNKQSTIVTQQLAYAYPVPIGNPLFRAESRLRKNEEEERRKCSRKEREELNFPPCGEAGCIPGNLAPLGAISCAMRLLRPLRHIPVYDRRFQGNLRTPFITGTGTIALEFYLIRPDFTLGEPVFLVKVFRLFRLE